MAKFQKCPTCKREFTSLTCPHCAPAPTQAPALKHIVVDDVLQEQSEVRSKKRALRGRAAPGTRKPGRPLGPDGTRVLVSVRVPAHVLEVLDKERGQQDRSGFIVAKLAEVLGI